MPIGFTAARRGKTMATRIPCPAPRWSSLRRPSPGRTRTCEPITVGVPLPRGLVQDPRRIGLVGDGQATVPLQALPTERWPDGSIRWALLDFQATGRRRRGSPLSN